MALDDKTKKYEPERYKYAAAAAQFIHKQDVKSTKKCLDNLLVDLGATDDDIKEGMVWNAYKDNPQKMAEGIAMGVQIYAGKYEKAMGEKTIKEMYERYSPEFEKYLSEEERAVAEAAFDKLGDETYASVLKKIKKLRKIIEDEDEVYSHEEKENAQKEFESKYAKVFNTIQEYEELRINKLMPSIREDTIKGNVKERFAEKKESE